LLVDFYFKFTFYGVALATEWMSFAKLFDRPVQPALSTSIPTSAEFIQSEAKCAAEVLGIHSVQAERSGDEETDKAGILLQFYLPALKFANNARK
jgi:hypothetical protein